MSDIELVIKIPDEVKKVFDDAEDINFSYYDYNSIIGKAIRNGTPLREICDRENSEIKNKVKDLSKRVENIENQMKKEKEEQIEKLKAEIDYAKFRCTL